MFRNLPLYRQLAWITTRPIIQRVPQHLPLPYHKHETFRQNIGNRFKMYSSSATPPSNSPQKPRFLLTFTCTVCNTRSPHIISKQAYNEGVVLVQCPGCDNRHLIADHLGWFQEGKVTVEDLVRRKGEIARKGLALQIADDGVLEYEADDDNKVKEEDTLIKEGKGRI